MGCPSRPIPPGRRPHRRHSAPGTGPPQALAGHHSPTRGAGMAGSRHGQHFLGWTVGSFLAGGRERAFGCAVLAAGERDWLGSSPSFTALPAALGIAIPLSKQRLLVRGCREDLLNAVSIIVKGSMGSLAGIGARIHRVTRVFRGHGGQRATQLPEQHLAVLAASEDDDYFRGSGSGIVDLVHRTVLPTVRSGRPGSEGTRRGVCCRSSDITLFIFPGGNSRDGTDRPPGTDSYSRGHRGRSTNSRPGSFISLCVVRCCGSRRSIGLHRLGQRSRAGIAGRFASLSAPAHGAFSGAGLVAASTPVVAPTSAPLFTSDALPRAGAHARGRNTTQGRE
jgi:hypothetical protein